MIRRVLVIAATLFALAAPAAGAYSHFGEQVGTQVLTQHWPTSLLPINLSVDGGPTNLVGEIITATSQWNAVTTARAPWGAATLAATDFDKNNLGTAWGDLSGDGRHEVVVDEDGSIITALGLAPASVNGMGITGGALHAGELEINDMYLLINGSRTNFDRQATEVHELGHTLGIAHSSLGFVTGQDGALAPPTDPQVPTMFPYSISTTDRRTLEADDRAALSELYPAANGSFTTTLGTITGTVTRCGSGDPVLGADVRAIKVDDPAVQLTRITGFDGHTDGSYTINGVPPGEYFVVVEPLGGDDDYLERLPIFTRVDTDFSQEFLNATEGDCAQDTDPDVKDSVQVGASGIKVADFEVEGASLALVIDVTGSMGPELTGLKIGLDAMISGLEATASNFPRTAIVTFDDASQLRIVSRDPDKLRDVINNLTTHSTADCPEGSNRALMTAGRQLGAGGVAVLVTDADSHRTGPRREAVESFYRSKGARLNTMLSGSCPPEQNPPRSRPRSARLATGTSPDEPRPEQTLGVENAVRTFAEESLVTGGLFSFQPAIKSGTADAQTRYADTLANLGISAMRPAVALVNPSTAPQGTTLEVELTGSGTGFRAGSTVAAGSGVTATVVRVLSPTRLAVRLTVAPGAGPGFRDVSVSTNRGDGTIEVANGIGALQVVGAPAGPTVLAVTPSTGAAGTTEDVTISGGATHFAAASVAALGPGVTVNHLTVTSPTSAVANVTIAPGAAIGFRDVTVQTGGELASETVPGPFLVTAAPPPLPRLTAATPAAGARGTSVDVTLTGADTAFAAGSSASVSGTGVRVLSSTVHGPTSVVARLAVAADAPLGFRDIRVITGAQSAGLLDGFEITPARAKPGGGGGQPAPCTDQTAPHASVTSARAKKRRLRVRGRATDTGCAASTVARVELAIARKTHHRCRYVKRSGRLTARRACSRSLFLAAHGTTSWRLTAKRKLPRGTYTIRVRARDGAGNLQRRAAKRTVRLR